MDKNEELQKWLNDDRYVQGKELTLIWNKSYSYVSALLARRNIKPVHKIYNGNIIRARFYNREDCEMAYRSIISSDVEILKSDDKYIRPMELQQLWQLSKSGVRLFLKSRNIKPIKTFHAASFYDRKECEDAEPFIEQFFNKKCESSGITTNFLSQLWGMSVPNVHIFLKKNGVRAKGKEKKQPGRGSGRAGYLYDLNECLMAKEKHVVVSSSEYDNNPIYVQRKELELLWCMTRGQVNVFLRERGIQPLEKIATNKGFCVYYDRAECERARPFINQSEQKEVEKVEEKQMELPEPTEQTPDIIPADTIDLFTMSELESELKQRGIELTADVRAKINASDMSEMQHIAKMLRGNAKTITIRLSVLNEIADQLVKSEKKVSWYEKIMTKIESKQSPDVKTSIKETSESLEVESKSVDTVNIAALSKKQTLDFIRNRLQFKERIYLRNVTGNHDMTKEHRRFDMSGYDDSKCGDCTLHNLAILNEFADLGIYDYTDYLFLDFYKGQPTLYMRYFKDDKHLNFELCGWTTSEIIYFIFQKTILSGKNKRRRD